MAKTNFAPLFIIAGFLIVAVLFGGTIITLATGLITQAGTALSQLIQSITGGLNPNPSPTPTPGPGNPTPSPTPGGGLPVSAVTFKIGGIGQVAWTDTTSGASGTVDKQSYPTGSATFMLRTGDKVSIQATGSSYAGTQFIQFTVSGSNGGTSTNNPLVIDLNGDVTVTAFFSYLTP